MKSGNFFHSFYSGILEKHLENKEALQELAYVPELHLALINALLGDGTSTVKSAFFHLAKERGASSQFLEEWSSSFDRMQELDELRSGRPGVDVSKVID